MNTSIIVLVISLFTLSLVVYILFKLRNKNNQEGTESSLFETKMTNFSEDLKKINEELISVTTPINQMNRFLGGDTQTGRLAEWNLNSIVEDIMPDNSYKFQFQINPQTQNRVDCAIKRSDGIWIPIDSKFYVGQYQNYQDARTETDRNRVLRDLKRKVMDDAEDIKEKYILDNITSKYAILYIASEKLIDLVCMTDNLRETCFAEKKVLIQGPNTLAASLDSIKLGHDCVVLNENASKVAEIIVKIQAEFKKLDISTKEVTNRLELAISDVRGLQTRVNVLGSELNKGAESLENTNEE